MISMFKMSFLLLCRESIERAKRGKNEGNYQKTMANTHGALLQWREKWRERGNVKVQSFTFSKIFFADGLGFGGMGSVRI